jgi:hypothetical protein
MDAVGERQVMGRVFPVPPLSILVCMPGYAPSAHEAMGAGASGTWLSQHPHRAGVSQTSGAMHRENDFCLLSFRDGP